MATEKIYSEVPEANDIIKELCTKQADVLWCVNPDNVTTLGVENKTRSKKCKTLAKITAIRGIGKEVLKLNDVMTRYVIDLYWEDWNAWSLKMKKLVIFHELIHIGSEGKLLPHDCQDFRILIDKLGVDWTSKGDQLPDVYDIKFDLDLRPGLEEDENGDGKEFDPVPEPEAEAEVDGAVEVEIEVPVAEAQAEEPEAEVVDEPEDGTESEITGNDETDDNGDDLF